MSDDFEARLTHLEESYLELWAGSVQQGVELVILRQLLDNGLTAPEKAARQARLDAARKAGIEECLRTLADHTPTLATQLRERLAHLLDETGNG